MLLTLMHVISSSLTEYLINTGTLVTKIVKIFYKIHKGTWATAHDVSKAAANPNNFVQSFLVVSISLSLPKTKKPNRLVQHCELHRIRKKLLLRKQHKAGEMS